VVARTTLFLQRGGAWAPSVPRCPPLSRRGPGGVTTARRQGRGSHAAAKRLGHRPARQGTGRWAWAAASYRGRNQDPDKSTFNGGSIPKVRNQKFGSSDLAPNKSTPQRLDPKTGLIFFKASSISSLQEAHTYTTIASRFQILDKKNVTFLVSPLVGVLRAVAPSFGEKRILLRFPVWAPAAV
jgi:hypothetical protein